LGLLILLQFLNLARHGNDCHLHLSKMNVKIASGVNEFEHCLEFALQVIFDKSRIC